MVHDFAEDTNITFSHKSLKKANKFISNDLSLLVHSSEQTEIISFRTKNKKITKNLNFRISGEKIDTIKQTKYLGISLDEGLTRKF